jgi:hypothetical protein
MAGSIETQKYLIGNILNFEQAKTQTLAAIIPI